MAITTAESKRMLKTVVTNTDEAGNIKKRTITLRNINSESTNDHLYELSVAVGGLLEGSHAAAVKITEEEIKNQI